MFYPTVVSKRDAGNVNEAFGYRLGDPGMSAVSRLALV
jgi:hypothetical protein